MLLLEIEFDISKEHFEEVLKNLKIQGFKMLCKDFYGIDYKTAHLFDLHVIHLILWNIYKLHEPNNGKFNFDAEAFNV
jgi:hypothetical protein